MALARCEFDATDEAGNLLSNVSVTVRREGGGLQQVYADRAGTTALGNPFVVVDGHVGFHAAGGAYRITMTAGDFTRERRWVAIGLAAETDFTLSRPAGGWDDEVAYEIGDLVYHDDYLFISRISANLDNEPDATTPGDTIEWMFAGAALEGPTGRGLSYDAQVDVLAERAAYDDEAEGFAVLVSDIGDGRAAVYVLGASSGDWSAPAIVTGQPGIGLPAGGAANQALKKVTAANYDTGWAASREVLTANRTYYVRTDGNNGNNGLANNSGGALLTIAAALANVAVLDTAGFTVTVQVQDGTWTVPVVLPSVQGITGPGQLLMQGNIGAPANCVVNVTGTPFSGTDLYGSVWDIKGFTLQGTGNGIQASSNSHLRFANIIFGVCGGNHISTGNRARISALTNYTISGSALRHILNDNVSTVSLNSVTVTITGTPAFPGGFMYTSKQSFTQALSTTFSGSATGPRYVIINSSFVETSSSANPTFWPGNSAGTWSSNSLYDGIAGNTRFEGIELGHASDTSLTRLSAGEGAIEGRRIVLSAPPVTKTADFTVADTETSLINNKSGSACLVTLPAAASFPGRRIRIKTTQAQQVNSASSNVIPLAGGSAAAAILTANAGRWADLESDATNWVIMAGVI